MSTFTQCNGPQTVGTVNTSALLDLIKQYQEVLDALSGKADKSIIDELNNSITTVQYDISALETRIGSLGNLTTSDITSIVAAINSLVSVTNEISKIIDANGYEHFTDDLNDGFKTQIENPSIVNCLNKLFVIAAAALPATDAASTYLTITAAGNSYGKKEDIEALDDVVTALSTAVSGLSKSVYALQRSVIEGVSFTSTRKYKAPFSGIVGENTSGIPGVFILGMLADDWDNNTGPNDPYKARAATAYLKFVNDYPFDIIVNMTVSVIGDALKQSAAINALYSRNSAGWEDTKLHVIRLTDSNGTMHNYLAISSKNLVGTESTDMYFYGAGINFYAPGSTGYIDPNGSAVVVATIELSNNTDTGFAMGNISIDLDVLSEADIEEIWYKYFNKYVYSPFNWSTTTATDPYQLNLYEYDEENDTYVATMDTTRNIDKTYYSRTEAQ